MFKVISYGEVLIDMLSNKLGSDHDNGQESFTKFPGGAPANVAAAVSRLGGEGYFVGKISTDMFGQFLKKSLNAIGVKTDYVTYTDTESTALAFVSLDENGERSFEFYRDNTADMNYRISDFKTEWFEGNGIFHACSNTLTSKDTFKVTMAGLQMAKNNDWIVSFDVNLRINLWAVDADPASRIWQCLSHANLIKFSKEEFEYLAGDDDEQSVLAKIFQSALLVLITDGGNPLRYFTKDGEGELLPPISDIVDSTAAGDAFVGGLLYSLAKDQVTASDLENFKVSSPELENALRFASRCGAYTVTKKGAFTALADQDDLKKMDF
ncbi:MAG: carbohydrate kinase [Kordiimonadaceae bacterium]|jgi:fructokinase|nr:carbohydrate kinase [Kordiimonadaceae bacterium]MBT6033253.1 carbohydrate kinase [Kordiimonadaceae bacterium]